MTYLSSTLHLIPLAQAFRYFKELFDRKALVFCDALLVEGLVVEDGKIEIASLPAQPAGGQFFIPNALEGELAVCTSGVAGDIPSSVNKFGELPVDEGPANMRMSSELEIKADGVRLALGDGEEGGLEAGCAEISEGDNFQS